MSLTHRLDALRNLRQTVVPIGQAVATSMVAAPVRTPSAPTEIATASALGAPAPDAISAAVPAAICVAAPAGSIGGAAPAAPAQRKSSASGNEKPSPSVPRSRKHATARTIQQAEINARPPSRAATTRGAVHPAADPQATARRLAARRRRATTTVAAAIPARTPVPAPGRTAPTKASGARAALSINPSITTESASARTPAGHIG